MAHTTERATTLLHSNPNLLTTVEKTIADVVENGANRTHLTSARNLLRRFPAEVQHAATKLQLEDSERMWKTLDGTAKALTRDNAALTSDNATLTNDVETLTNDVETLTNDNADLTQEVESLRLLLADSADGEELAALTAGAKAANAARRVSLVAVKREREGGKEKRASKRTRK